MHFCWAHTYWNFAIGCTFKNSKPKDHIIKMPIKDSYQIINQNYNSNLLILCDHATNRIPKTVSERGLGLDDSDLKRHIAYDLGAKKIAGLISKNLNATMICTNFSRLVIDPNRSEKDPTLIMQLYDGIIISENIKAFFDKILYKFLAYGVV